jgi:hypothetical protein
MVFLDSFLMGVHNSLLAAQKSFLDNSKASGFTANPKLALQAQAVGFSGIRPTWSPLKNTPFRSLNDLSDPF